MNRTTSVIVALIAAATLSTISIAVPHQALAWGKGGGHGGPGPGGGCGGGGCGGFGGGFYNGPILPYWSYGFLGNGGVLVSPPILAGLFDPGFGCGGCGGFGGPFGGFGGPFGGFGGGPFIR
jgi:hypothetical protein